MNASEVTRRLRERALYASFLTQRNRIDGGCGVPMNLSNTGGATSASSLIPVIKEGDLFTTADQRATLLADSTCIVRPNGNDCFYMIGTFDTDPLEVFGSNQQLYTEVGRVSNGTTTFLVKFDNADQPQWYLRIGCTSDSNNGDAQYPSVHVSGDGNVYVTFLSSPDRQDNGRVVFYNSNNDIAASLYAQHDYIAVLAKYNSNGGYLWSTYVAVDDHDNLRPYVVSDYSNDAYLTFYAYAPITIYEANNTAVKATIADIDTGSDNFLVKYRSDGEYLWCTRMSGEDWEDPSYIICDKNNNVYLTSQSSSRSIRVYCATDLTTPEIILAGDPNYNYYNYIVKLNSYGVVQWGTAIRGSQNTTKVNPSVDSEGNVYVAGGYYNTSINLYHAYDINTPAITLPNSGGYDIYIVKFNSKGRVMWGSHHSGADNEQQPFTTIDAEDYLIITGTTQSDTMDLYYAGSTDVDYTVTFPSGQKTYLMKYSPSGVMSWTTYIGISNVNMRPYVRCNSARDIYVTGLCNRSSLVCSDTSLNPTNVELTGLDTSSRIFLVKYNTNGVPQWVTRMTNGYVPAISISYFQ